jgi:PAS domain S-box-containing protein
MVEEASLPLSSGPQQRLKAVPASGSQETDDRFRALAESAQDGIVCADDTGVIVYANPSANRMFGYSPGELEGSALTALMPEGARPAHLTAFARLLETGETRIIGQHPVELMARRRDDSEFPVELSLSTWTSGSRKFFTGVLRDIGQRKRAEESLRRSESLYRLLSEAAIAVGSAPDLNRAMQALGDASKSVADVERISFAVREPDDALMIAATWGPAGWRFPEGERIEISANLGEQWRAGRAVVVQDTADCDGPTESELLRRGIRSFLSVPIIAGSELQGLLNFSSVRPHGISVEVVPVLEALVREASGPFNTLRLLHREREAAKRLEELNRVKNEFVGIVAHDLKSPMTVMAGFAELMIAQWESISDDQKLELLGRIRENTARLSVLVDDVLHVAKIESGEVRYDIRPFDLRGLLERTVLEMNSTNGDRCDLEIAGDVPQALGDESKQWRILTNLVSNALKFSAAGSRVVVGARPAGDEILVWVCDHGWGIAGSDLERLFQRFSRIQHKAGAHVTGTGLGLYICKSLVEGQGGRVWATSRLGEGSTFFYTVPVAGE